MSAIRTPCASSPSKLRRQPLRHLTSYGTGYRTRRSARNLASSASHAATSRHKLRRLAYHPLIGSFRLRQANEVGKRRSPCAGRCGFRQPSRTKQRVNRSLTQWLSNDFSRLPKALKTVSSGKTRGAHKITTSTTQIAAHSLGSRRSRLFLQQAFNRSLDNGGVGPVREL